MNGSKLTLLMQLTGTSSAALARALSFDPSYISRIRSGKRGMPLHQPFAEPAAAYFSRKIRRDEGLKRAAASLMELRGEWPDKEAEGTALIAEWLLSEEPFHVREEARPLQAAQMPPDFSGEPFLPVREDTRAAVLNFIGNAGKRRAVLLFLDSLIREKYRGMLRLYSDENMDWLTEDPAFTKLWEDRMCAYLAQGGSVQIIHTVRRDIGEMSQALKHWLGLYMTGRIFPFYCPRTRDWILRRTIFAAEGCMAVLSHSVGEQTEGMLNTLVSSEDAVAAALAEYDQLLLLCRPLMRILYPKDTRLRREIEDRLHATGESLLRRTLPGGIRVEAEGNIGALFTRESADAPAFFIEEQNILQAVLAYLGQ